MVLYACLRHALFGVAMKPTTIAAAPQSWDTCTLSGRAGGTRVMV